MRKVYDKTGLVVGFHQVVVEGENNYNYNVYSVYGKVSAGLPEVHKSSKGTEFKKVLQLDPYQSNAVVELAAIGTDDNGNYQFAKTTNDKGKEVYVRNRVAGLNFYNIAMVKDTGELVMYLAEEPETKVKTSGFDSI